MIEIKIAEDCLARIKTLIPEHEYRIAIAQINLLIAQEVLREVDLAGRKIAAVITAPLNLNQKDH